MAVAALLAILVVLYGVFLFVYFLAGAKIKLSVRNGRAEISAPFHSCSFRLSDIGGVRALDSMPGGMRTNGFSAGRRRAGTFVLEGTGPCRVYVCRREDPVLLISLADGLPCLLNGETQEQTMLWRDMLLGRK